MQKMKENWQILLSVEGPFVFGPALLGLAVIRGLAEHLDVLGPLALFIGMTPMIYLFIYSLPVPIWCIFLGLILIYIGRMRLFKTRSNSEIQILIFRIYIISISLIVLGAVLFFLMNFAFNVGQGPVPKGWKIGILLSSGISEIGTSLILGHWCINKICKLFS